jgi:hypothetical protein
MDKVVDSILIRKENISYQGKVRGGEEGISQIYFYFFSTGNKKEQKTLVHTYMGGCG